MTDQPDLAALPEKVYEAIRSESPGSGQPAWIWARSEERQFAEAIAARLHAAGVRVTGEAGLDVNGLRLLWAIRAERSLLRAMVTWPEGANGPLAIGAYEAMVRRLHKWSEADDAALRAALATDPDPAP